MVLKNKISELIKEYGLIDVQREVENLGKEFILDGVATIICNSGMHSFPGELLRGEVFEFTSGMIDMSSKESIESCIASRLVALASFLKSGRWRKIYIIVSGHPILSMQVKLAVYRVTRLETSDWLYNGNGRYIEISLPVRKIMSENI